MNNEQLEELVKRLGIIAHDLKTEHTYASDVVEQGSKTIAEMHLFIQLLKARVGLLEYQLQGKAE